MTALAKDRQTAMRAPAELFEFPVAASAKIYAGSLVVLDTAGNLEPGSTATGKIAAGRAEEYVDNSAGIAAAKNCKVRRGCFRWANGNSITKANIGDQAYVVDDQTVSSLATGKSAAGVIVDVDSDGVWVDTYAPLLAPSTGLLAANNLSDINTAATACTNLGLGTGDGPTFDHLHVTNDVAAGSVTSSGVATGRRKTQTVAANAYTVTAADGDIVIAAAADNDVVTLPDAAAGNAGLRITVQNRGADGAAKVSISPHSSDKIVGGIHGAATGDLVSFSGAANKDIINTKATSKQGDYAVLVSDGVDTWWVVGGKGVWASES